MKGKTGGVGFIIKRSLECEAGRYEWLLGSIYMNCEGIRGDENVFKMLCVKDVVRNAKDEGLKIMIGGDMNAHIWELDKCENNNGKLLKNMVNEMNLQIMNCVWERMNGPTWFSENSEFTLDYICVDDCALKSVHRVQNGSPGSTRFCGPVHLRRYWSVPVSTGPYILGRPVKFSNSQDADNLHTIRKRGCQYLSNDTWIINSLRTK